MKQVTNSHEELDKVFASLLQTCPQFAQEYQAEYDLLKAYDRAYWIRYNEGIASQLHEVKPCKEGCLFNQQADKAPQQPDVEFSESFNVSSDDC